MYEFNIIYASCKTHVKLQLILWGKNQQHKSAEAIYNVKGKSCVPFFS